MLPVIALVGRPNVGKSTLFNALTRSRDALVADEPGLTRDRQYGYGLVGSRRYVVIDTGGLEAEADTLAELMARQTRRAVAEADEIVFLVDGRAGLTPADERIAAELRRAGKTVYLAVNKTEGVAADLAVAEFHALGLGVPWAIAAAHGRGVEALVEAVLADLPEAEAEPEDSAAPAIAIIGRPNVGKSTLINRLLGDERVVASAEPGTTRDSIAIELERGGQHYTLIDTAGVRRRSRVQAAIEKFSIVKTLQAIDRASVVIALIDAQEGVTDQDVSLLGLALERGRAAVIGINKWDGLDTNQRNEVRRLIDVKLPFLNFARIHFISALHGSGVGDLFGSIDEARRAAEADLNTNELTQVLADAVSAHPPPLIRGRRIKLRYAHQGGRCPPLIVVHGNQTGAVPDTYRRYLVNAFRAHFSLHGTPVRIEFRSGENPYAGKRNKLTSRQIEKKKRLKRHVKRSKK
ncbi:MAG TPA: ribosome biogenesis GTPase Der [Gammaproteobacteria bacterium]|nr:ribosome biogenesis GTPase Der [Gammaproteobacteria bacterium]